MVAFELLGGKRVRVSRSGWWGVAAGLMFTLFVTGELVDIGIGNKLYMSVTVYDQSLRTAFVDAVMRTGVPPGIRFIGRFRRAAWATPRRCATTTSGTWCVRWWRR